MRTVFTEVLGEQEALRLLDLIDAEFRSNPLSQACFDARLVARVAACVEARRRLERLGDVPPILTGGSGS